MAEQEPKRFRIGGEGEEPRITVHDLSTGEVVYRPDVARQALGQMAAALDAGGIDFVVPDDISSLVEDPNNPTASAE